ISFFHSPQSKNHIGSANQRRPRDGLLDLLPLQAALLASNVAPAALRLPGRRKALAAVEAAALAVAPRTRAAARTVLGGVHAQRAAAELMSIEALDRFLRILFGLELHKRKAPRPSALAVGRQKHILDRADLGKKS